MLHNATPSTPASAETAHADHKQRAHISQLMTRYGAGDGRAFAELYTLLRPRLGRLCGAVMKGAEVEDLLQEVFMKLHRHRASFVPHGNAVAWSYAVARRTCIDRLRDPARRREVPTEHDRLEHCFAEGTTEADPHAVGAALQGRLEILSECVRQTYVLVKVQGLSCAEAASVLGTTPGAIKQRVHRARAELRAELRAAGSDQRTMKRTRDKQCA
jgi:RNA polymerase sigma-70 factor (ECF subfamily)